MKSKCREHDNTIGVLEKRKGFDLSKYGGIEKNKVLRNCVEPETGLEIFNAAQKKVQRTLD